MPRIVIKNPMGLCFAIDTRETDTLKKWFDEVLPHTFIRDRLVTDGMIAPDIMVQPMLSWQTGKSPDWHCDSRVLGQWHRFDARDGESGLRALEMLRARLARELEEMS